MKHMLGGGAPGRRIDVQDAGPTVPASGAFELNNVHRVSKKVLLTAHVRDAGSKVKIAAIFQRKRGAGSSCRSNLAHVRQ